MTKLWVGTVHGTFMQKMERKYIFAHYNWYLYYVTISTSAWRNGIYGKVIKLRLLKRFRHLVELKVDW